MKLTKMTKEEGRCGESDDVRSGLKLEKLEGYSDSSLV